MKRTGGNWDPHDWPVYFAAANMGTLVDSIDVTSHMLIAVNELNGPAEVRHLHGLLDAGISLFVDSGVFWLSTQHAKKHGLTMDQALSMAPADVDDFAWLFDRYVELLTEIGPRVWGYIEIDQGGRENKIKTRERLEALGLRPIPVYHPFNDGWDYFDFLARNYDRICFGNVVQADPETRKRLVATAFERRKNYPHLWIHMLGLTPSERSNAYPLPSCDSSTWIGGVRWGQHNAMVANRRCWETGAGFVYRPGAHRYEPDGNGRARKLAGYETHIMNRTMRAVFEEQKRALGFDQDFFKGDA